MPYVVKCEMELRQGQANDALHSLRIAIAQKSFVFRTRIRKNAPTAGYTKRLRGYGDARAVQVTISLAAKVYSISRNAMSILSPESAVLEKYKILTKEDLVASTAVADPNARGQSRTKLSWIWQVVSNSDNPEFLDQRRFYFLFCLILIMSHPLLQSYVSIGCARSLEMIAGPRKRFFCSPKCHGHITTSITTWIYGLSGRKMLPLVRSVTHSNRQSLGRSLLILRRRRLIRSPRNTTLSYFVISVCTCILYLVSHLNVLIYCSLLLTSWPVANFSLTTLRSRICSKAQYTRSMLQL